MDTKRDKLSFRLSTEEKALITQRAKKLRMDFSQYVRHMVLSEPNEQDDELPVKETKAFEQHQDLLTRLIVNNHLKTNAIAEELLTKELIEDIMRESIKQYKLLGVEKK